MIVIRKTHEKNMKKSCFPRYTHVSYVADLEEELHINDGEYGICLDELNERV